jgi:hypothetical protein
LSGSRDALAKLQGVPAELLPCLRKISGYMIISSNRVHSHMIIIYYQLKFDHTMRPTILVEPTGISVYSTGSQCITTEFTMSQRDYSVLQLDHIVSQNRSVPHRATLWQIWTMCVTLEFNISQLDHGASPLDHTRAHGEQRVPHQDPRKSQQDNTAGQQDHRKSQQDNTAGQQDHIKSQQDNTAGQQDHSVSNFDYITTHLEFHLHALCHPRTRVSYNKTTVCTSKQHCNILKHRVLQQDHSMSQWDPNVSQQDYNVTQKHHSVEQQDH